VCICALQTHTHSIPGRCCYIKRTPRVSLAHSTDAAQDLFFTFTGGTCRARGPSTAQPTPKAHTPSPYSHTSSSIASTLLNVNRVDCRRVDGRPPRSDPVFGHLAPPVGAPKCIQWPKTESQRVPLEEEADRHWVVRFLCLYGNLKAIRLMRKFACSTVTTSLYKLIAFYKALFNENCPKEKRVDNVESFVKSAMNQICKPRKFFL
jgi:hypothetical protein